MEVESIPDLDRKDYTVYAISMWHDIHCLVCVELLGWLKSTFLLTGISPGCATSFQSPPSQIEWHGTKCWRMKKRI